MTTYAIGDVQGCFDPLRRLLDRLRFDPAADRIILVGDLVNRGPASLPVLRFLRDLGNSAVCLLGNHDLHLLAVAARREPVKAKDSFQDILEAADRDSLLDWLRHRPLAWRDPTSAVLAVHAGLPPQWDGSDALRYAAEAETILRGADAGTFFTEMYGDEPDHWEPGLQGWDRLRFIINCLTRLRYCHPDGRIDLHHKGPPGTQPAGLLPWFEVPGRRSAGERVVFGHWSTLGQIQWQSGAALGLDTGCVWGGRLTALNLLTGAVASVECADLRPARR